MTTHLEVRRGSYHDSVALMQVSRATQDVDGVEAALVAMATELNLDFLGPMGFDTDVDAGPNDLLVALRARDDDALAAGLAAVDAALAGSTRDGGGAFGEAAPPRTTAAALRRSDAPLVLVSTPGEHAAAEAYDALHAGANVMIFSDNVPVDAEVALKRLAADRGLLVMGPDCGTAMVAGVGLGFANAVRPGPVGIVAASGTGAQQLTCLLDDAGVGTSHVLGVGGRDLKAEVGGLATLQAMAALDQDPATELIVVLSKPPAESVAAAVREAADGLTTPVVLGLLGPGRPDLTALAATVVERLGSERLGSERRAPTVWDAPDPRQPRAGRLVGLFSGGTLATEAMVVASERIGPIRSNVPLDPAWALDGDADTPHEVLDLGEDEFTRGRPHPMIDPTLRLERITALGDDTAVLLLDVVLGHGAHDDPAADLAPAIADLRERTGASVVVSLCGAQGDPQGRDRQAERLRDAGASVHLSNADAARTAAALIDGGTR
jgi:FdrA protein